MKSGKLNDKDLKKLVFSKLPPENESIVCGPGTGLDCAILKNGNSMIAVSSDPVTGAGADIGKIAVNVSCNDIACCGIAPVAIMVVILAPQNSTKDQIAEIASQIADTAGNLNVSVAGGHTEISDAVNRFVVVTTAFGYANEGKIIKSSGAKDGDSIIITKFAALEGTSIIAKDFEEKIKGILSNEEIIQAKKLSEQISVVKEGVLCGQADVNAMHDITEGGVLGACWEMAESAGLGCEIHLNEVPVLPVTFKICNMLSINPYKLISSGSMLISTKSPHEVMKMLSDNDISCKIIGKFVKKNRVYIDFDGKKHELSQPEADELYKVFKKD